MNGISGTMEQLKAWCNEYGDMPVLQAVNLIADKMELESRICTECGATFEIERGFGMYRKQYLCLTCVYEGLFLTEKSAARGGALNGAQTKNTTQSQVA